MQTARVRLADGRDVWLRPLVPADAPALVALCRRLSDDTIRRRFFRLLPGCDGGLAAELANVDQDRRVAIAAAPSPDAGGPILGVARFHRSDDAQAELAIVVEDAYQQLGLGRHMLARLFDEARARALRLLYGYVGYGNQPVLRLLKGSGHPLRVSWHGGDVLDVQLDV